MSVVRERVSDLLLQGRGEDWDAGGGGDSRHHGRSSIAPKGKGAVAAAHRQKYLLERTAALVPPTLDPAHIVLSHRRYSVCISDLKCVLNVDGMARHFASFPIDKELPKPSSVGADYFTTRSRNDLSDDDIGCALDDWIQVSAPCPFWIAYFLCFDSSYRSTKSSLDIRP